MRWITARLSWAAIGALTAILGGGTGAIAAPAVQAIGLESQYADVISQVGGPYVHVSAIETDPNTDPHSFEASPRVAAQLAGATLIVENGLGYDGWADKMLAATVRPDRIVIDVQSLLHLPDTVANPHLWYDPRTMPAVAAAVAAALSRADPAHADYFQAHARIFVESLVPWRAAIAAFRHRYPGAKMAVTEPVGDDLLQAMGADIATPFSLQAAIMNGTDPSPQDVAAQEALLSGHAVKVFVYNQQVTDPLTQTFLDLAVKNRIPVVGVYETMPAGYDYQDWMVAETQALDRAVTANVSTAILNKAH
jgi:zinc/manganese transport system substrate-binding protein